MTVAALALLACTREPADSQPLRLIPIPAGADSRLVLAAAPGIKLNARVKPALELPDGSILRFDSPHLTPDSAYFTRPPTARLPGPARRATGTLRASICADDKAVCRSVVLEL